MSPLFKKYKTRSTPSMYFGTLSLVICKVRSPIIPLCTQTYKGIGKCQGITITPFNAGHTLGGTIWKIRSPSYGTILYAVNMNHMRERHLDGTVLIRQAGGIFEPLARPDLFITDADRANVITSRRKDRDASLIGK